MHLPAAALPGSRNHDDADRPHHAPDRAAATKSSGARVRVDGGNGLPSRAMLSRFVDRLNCEENPDVLKDGILANGLRQIRERRPGRTLLRRVDGIVPAPRRPPLRRRTGTGDPALRRHGQRKPRAVSMEQVRRQHPRHHQALLHPDTPDGKRCRTMGQTMKSGHRTPFTDLRGPPGPAWPPVDSQDAQSRDERTAGGDREPGRTIYRARTAPGVPVSSSIRRNRRASTGFGPTIRLRARSQALAADAVTSRKRRGQQFTPPNCSCASRHIRQPRHPEGNAEDLRNGWHE